MTAPSPVVQLTPEIHAYFKRYLERNLAWGIYHVWLDDCNWDLEVDEAPPCGWSQDYATPCTDEDRRMWALFREMTPSQRRRVRDRATPKPPPEPAIATRFRVIGVDHESGIVTLSGDE